MQNLDNDCTTTERTKTKKNHARRRGHPTWNLWRRGRQCKTHNRRSADGYTSKAAPRRNLTRPSRICQTASWSPQSPAKVGPSTPRSQHSTAERTTADARQAQQDTTDQVGELRSTAQSRDRKIVHSSSECHPNEAQTHHNNITPTAKHPRGYELRGPHPAQGSTTPNAQISAGCGL